MNLICFRISELDAQFSDLQVKEQQWPLPGPDVTPMYKKYLTHIYKLGQNIVCACCGCISHDITEFEIVPQSYNPLYHLRIPEDVNIPFDFSCGIDVLEQNRVLIDKLTIQVQLDSSDIDHIKSIVRTAPRHVEAEYHWPFNANVAKFTSKDSKDKLTRDFEPILDGRGIENLKNYTENLGDLTVDDVMKGAKVSIEYSSVPYGDKKSRGNDDDFPPECTFKLYSITILGMMDRSMLDVSSLSKRTKLNYS